MTGEEKKALNRARQPPRITGPNGGVAGEMSTMAATRPAGRKRAAGLTLAALGVVFGDIGTSPLYTVQTCFSDFTGLKPTHGDVLGILSLITWALIIVVTVKYVFVVMRAIVRDPPPTRQPRSAAAVGEPSTARRPAGGPA